MDIFYLHAFHLDKNVLYPYNEREWAVDPSSLKIHHPSECKTAFNRNSLELVREESSCPPLTLEIFVHSHRQDDVI